MARYKNFEELPVWKDAIQLYNVVLDLADQPGIAFPYGFIQQLNRAALSVSNNIAEGFERSTTDELLHFLAISRGSAGEVRSMLRAVQNRPNLQKVLAQMEKAVQLSLSCARQLTAWENSILGGSVQGNRHLDPQSREQKRATEAAKRFRLNFLKNLTPDHRLFNSSEARSARGEQEG